MDDTSCVDELRRRLASVTALSPPDVEITSFHEMEPTFSIVLLTKSLNIESELCPMHGKGILELGVDRTVVYAFGPVHATSREKRNRTVELMNMCPER